MDVSNLRSVHWEMLFFHVLAQRQYGYDFAWGTSMASPAVAGGLALLYQRYKQLNGNSQSQKWFNESIDM